MKERRETVLVVGGGGREAALVDKYAEKGHRVLAVPGNPAMLLDRNKNVQIFTHLKTTDVLGIVEVALERRVGLADIAQDNAVAVGLTNRLIAVGVPTAAPTKDAGQIEWDKVFAREFGRELGLPQPFYRVCQSEQEGFEFIQSQSDQPWFVKASGLAEGKGALPAHNNKEAIERIKEMKRFGDAGATFLIEEWLRNDDGSAGEEFSAYIISDGERYRYIGSAQDYKRANDNDEGENTGSMGCNSPTLVVDSDVLSQTKDIFKKTISGLRARGREYKGVLYLGGIVVIRNGRRKVYVIEFNARWGDPEAQGIVPGIKNDLYDVNMAVAKGDIRNINLETDGKARVVITGASKGYPGNYDSVRGKEIIGIDDVRKLRDVRFYGAGINVENGRYYANGGRLFYIVGEGGTINEAQVRGYEAMERVKIEDDNLHFRTDIAWRDVQKLRK